MKRLLAIIMAVLCMLSIIGCSNDNETDSAATSSTNDTSSYYNSFETESACAHYYSDATCTSPRKCSLCGETSGLSLGHSYSGKSCSRCGAKNPNYTEPTHTHSYTSKVTRNATCSTQGVRTYSCNCGHSYTESISTTYHNWEYATCTTPKTCKTCGTTEGSANGHNYYSDGKCGRCGAINPEVTASLSKCSLELPTLPQTVSYYSYSGKKYSSVKVTGITYEFEPYSGGNVILTCKFSGEKTYDYQGSGQSSSCYIGWKLYDPEGNVFRTGTFRSPNVAVGETFANQEEDLIYNFEASKPGKYKLVILDSN